MDPRYLEKLSNGNRGREQSDNQRKTTSIALKTYFQRNPRKKKNNTTLEIYRANCKFKFNVYDYPNEFDLPLVKNLGWYKPSNKGNNLNGVSMDHKISIHYGFLHKIDPEIMSHPTNCQLMPHNQNISKGKKNTISFDDLLILIEKWKINYGGVVQREDRGPASRE